MVYLMPEQTACAIKVFLNIFGLLLEDKKEITENDKLKIYDSENNHVGYYYLDNNKAFINVEYKDNTLKASYPVPKTQGIIDWESSGAKFASWTCPVDFIFINSDKTTFKGEIKLACFVDSELGIKCTCHSDFNYKINETRNIHFRLFNGSSFFEAELCDTDFREHIDLLTCFNEFIGYSMVHLRNKSNFVKLAGIYEYATEPGYKRLITRDVEKDGYKIKNVFSHSDTKIKKRENEDNDDENFYITFSNNIDLMRGADPELFDMIKLFLKLIKAGDAPLIENLVKVSYDSYSDEIVKKVFDIDRNKSIYQDGSNKLKEAYFGMETNKISVGNDIIHLK